jgi:hypothetical protein
MLVLVVVRMGAAEQRDVRYWAPGWDEEKGRGNNSSGKREEIEKKCRGVKLPSLPERLRTVHRDPGWAGALC